MIDPLLLIRPHLRNLVPYSSARDEYSGREGIFLDANENSFGSVTGGPYNRYPDPYQRQVKELLAGIKGMPETRIFLGNGSDEIIDLVIRLFCRPGKDRVVITPPTYGMYEVSARINEAGVIPVPLISGYQLNIEAILDTRRSKPKILFLCTPNNPSGNSLNRASVLKLIRFFPGMILVDEAYSDFSGTGSYLPLLDKHRNLIIMQTFSKAWGMAGLRLGVAYAHESLVRFLNKIKPPYNINQATQDLAVKALKNIPKKESWVRKIIAERKWLEKNLNKLDIVEKVNPSETNFLLVKFRDSGKVFNYLQKKLIIVRDRSKVVQCDNSLRITVGTKPENRALLEALKNFR